MPHHFRIMIAHFVTGTTTSYVDITQFVAR
jgi:hypothetical protein